jgi:hypothetical protein
MAMALMGGGGQSVETLVGYLGQGKYGHCGCCVEKRRFPNIPANVLADFQYDSGGLGRGSCPMQSGVVGGVGSTKP